MLEIRERNTRKHLLLKYSDRAIGITKTLGSMSKLNLFNKKLKLNYMLSIEYMNIQMKHETNN